MSNHYNNSRTAGDIELGKVLTSARKLRNLTQQSLATMLSRSTHTTWSQVRVSNYETGRNPLNVSTFVQVCTVLDVSPTSMLYSSMQHRPGVYSVPVPVMPEPELGAG